MEQGPTILQSVTTLGQKRNVIKWMIEKATEDGEHQIALNAINEFEGTVFPKSVPGSKRRLANLVKARQWWKTRNEFLQSIENDSNINLSMSSPEVVGKARQRVYLKSRPGRGRKRQQWKLCLYEAMLDEFEKMLAAQIQITKSFLKDMEISLSQSDDLELKPPNGTEDITKYLIQDFCALHNIVFKVPGRTHSKSPEWSAYYDRLIANHLGKLKSRFAYGIYEQDLIFNLDETHFIIDFNNLKALGFSGECVVSYNELASVTEGFTLALLLRGGSEARIESGIAIFKNTNCSYPIRGVQDNVQNVCYRSGPKAWMDKRVFLELLKEKKCISKDVLERMQSVFTDNANSHKITAELENALWDIETEIEYLPINSTHKTQALDLLIFSQVKRIWREIWFGEKNSRIENGKWLQSGRIQNPGKNVFLQLTGQVIEEVNKMKDAQGRSLVRSAMIKSGLSNDWDGFWRKEQLTRELQEIINKYPENYDGEVPIPPNKKSD